MLTFDGAAKLIVLSAGTTTLDVRDCYSRWKDWVLAGHAQHLAAFAAVGGDPLGGDVSVTFYAFLSNGWKIRPYEGSHKLIVNNGVLGTSDGGDPFVQTLGAYTVLVQYSQPVKTETVNTGGGGGSTPAQVADAVWQHVTGVDVTTKLALIQKILRNRTITDPSAGTMTVYDDDDTTPLLTAALYEDVAGTQGYRGQGADRRERLA